jgi:hypothetical protein
VGRTLLKIVLAACLVGADTLYHHDHAGAAGGHTRVNSAPLTSRSS